MPRSPEPTRTLLLDAASRLFAERGVHNVSLAEIVREANQKNVSALHYHFGGWEALVEAVLARYIPRIRKRRLALLDVARQTPASNLRSPVEALVLPLTELALDGPQGLEYIHIGAELGTGPDYNLPGIQKLFHETAGVLVFELIRDRLPALPDAVLRPRFNALALFTGRAASDRARMYGVLASGTALSDEEFTANLVDMVVGALSSPQGVVGSARRVEPRRAVT